LEGGEVRSETDCGTFPFDFEEGEFALPQLSWTRQAKKQLLPSRGIIILTIHPQLILI
jgi:hypothetical protein